MCDPSWTNQIPSSGGAVTAVGELSLSPCVCTSPGAILMFVPRDREDREAKQRRKLGGRGGMSDVDMETGAGSSPS